MPPPQQTESVIPMVALSISIISLAVSVIGWFVVHRLAVARDRAQRKREFIGFLRQWRAEIDNPSDGVGNEFYLKAFLAKSNQFHDEIELVRDIYSGDKRFKTLTERIWNRNKEEWRDKDPRPMIHPDIDALLEIL